MNPGKWNPWVWVWLFIAALVVAWFALQGPHH